MLSAYLPTLALYPDPYISNLSIQTDSRLVKKEKMTMGKEE
jgi:hypothetical protein